MIEPKTNADVNTGILEKMIVANGSVTMDLNMNGLNGARANAKGSRSSTISFDIERDSFFTVMVFNNELRGPLPSSMALIAKDGAQARMQGLWIESVPFGSSTSELVVRDGNGMALFNIEGQVMDYSYISRELAIGEARLVLTKEYATELGRLTDAGTVVGSIQINANLRAVEVAHIVDGVTKSDSMPASANPEAGTVPGPDVVVGDLNGLAQFGSASGTRVGLAVGTDSCNYGTVDLNWFQLPSNDHPVIPQNMYRMSGGPNGDDKIEQIGQSQVKHAFQALTQNLCGLGCNGVGNTRLGSGCSDPYSASLNAGPNLGSRAFINPFTGAYPDGNSATPPNLHGSHSHNGTSHRILTEIADLSTSQNPGATYFAEAQYVTPHEYVHCQANPAQCNMNNNVSYRRYTVSGTASPFNFSPAAATVRQKAAIAAWTGSTAVTINPAPGVDGIGTVAYKVTNPSAGVWQYEYAIYNQNIDRAIQSFSVPVGSGASLSNVGFHAPPQHPGSSNDGTVGGAGFSSTAWAQSQAGGAMTWSSETFAQNQNANALRWGTMYNYRFTSNRPPTTVNATIGFYKTGSPITVSIQAPSAAAQTGPFSISGRVLNAGGTAGIGGIYVFLIDSNGIVRNSVTSPFGFYGFDTVPGGATYILGASSKRYGFPVPTNVEVNSNLTDMNLQAEAP